MTEKVKFEALAGIQFSMVCPACGTIHRWKQATAWIEGGVPAKDLPRFKQKAPTSYPLTGQG
jgi:hypothetical protein